MTKRRRLSAELAALRAAMWHFRSPSDRPQLDNWETEQSDGPPPDVPRFMLDRALLSPIRSQGLANCCTSFAIAAAAEVQWRRTRGASIRLAPGFIHRCVGQLDDQQGYDPITALADCLVAGLARGFEGDYPFPFDRCQTQDRIQVHNFGWLAGPNNALRWIAEQGPVIADLYIEPDSFVRLPPDRVYTTASSQSLLLHTVLVVGFDLIEGHATVQNSFGPSWANRGFGRVALGTGGGFLTRRGASYLLV